MRHAAGQLADGLHLLAVGEAHLEVFLLGLVEQVQHGHRLVAAAGVHQRHVGEGVHHLAIFQAQGERQGRHGAIVLPQFAEGVGEARAVFLVDEFDETDGAAIRHGALHQLAEGAVGFNNFAVARQVQDGDGRQLDEAVNVEPSDGGAGEGDGMVHLCPQR